MRVVICAVFAVIVSAEAAKILGVFPMSTHSHFSLGNRYFRELALRGHEVTVITPFRDPKPVGANYQEVVLDNLDAVMQDFQKGVNMYEVSNQPFYIQYIIMAKMGFLLVEETLKNPGVQDLLNSNATFDLILMEQFFNDGLRVFQHRFKAPCIISSAMAANSWTNHLVGNPTFPAYIPESILKTNAPLSFSQRVLSLTAAVYGNLLNHYYYFPTQEKIMQEYVPDAPPLDSLIYDTSLILANSHVSMNHPRPILPNVIEVGGYHVPRVKKLPDDLQTFLDDSTEGVVLFSMGSNLKSRNLPTAKREEILKAFSKLKLKVLWKWEDETLPGQPNNVVLRKWLPQNDILAHSNVKIFITHGGLLSTTEAIFHGVPVIGIPIYGDQQSNMGLTENLGCGLSLSFSHLSEKLLTNALNEIIDNPRYSENAKQRQKLMADQPVKPIDNAMFWIEYVIRHRGASHFRSPALDMMWYEIFYIDLLAVIIGALVVIKCLVKITCKGGNNKRKCCSSKKKKE